MHTATLWTPWGGRRPSVCYDSTLSALRDHKHPNPRPDNTLLCVQDRLDSTASTTDQEQHGWRGGGGGGGNSDIDISRSHGRSHSADGVPTGAAVGTAEGGDALATREAAVASANGESGSRNTKKKRNGDKTVRRTVSSLCLPTAVQQLQQRGGEKKETRGRRRSSSGDEHGLATAGGGGGYTEDGGGDDDDDRSHLHHQHHTFPDLFGACRPGHNNHRRGRMTSSPSTPVATRKQPVRPSSLDRNRTGGSRRDRLSAGRRSLSNETPHTAAHRWIQEDGDGSKRELRAAVGAGGAARQGGWTSDDGGAGGHGAGVRGSRRRRRLLASSSFSQPPAAAVAAPATGTREAGQGERGEIEGEEEGEQDGETGVGTAMAAVVVSAAAAAGIGGGGGDGASRRWKPIDKLSRALGSTRRKASMQAGGLGRDGADRGAGNEVQQVNKGP